MSKIFIISDTHFGHKMLVDKGYRIPDFEKDIIHTWNTLIQPDDVVIHLGDFNLGRYGDLSHKETVKYWVSQLNGGILLVRGNHDHYKWNEYINMGFRACLDSFTLESKRKDGYILFTHEPEPDTDAVINIHGHLHGNEHRLTGELEGYPWQQPWKYYDMSNHDEIGYFPLELETVLENIYNKKKENL